MSFFKINIDGEDKTDFLKKNLLNLKIQDKEGLLCDSACLTCVDRELIALPKTGKELEIFINGYKMGSFRVHNISVSSTKEIVINAKSFDYRSGFKTQKNNRSWNNSLYEIATEIASKYGLEPAISEKTKEVKINEIQKDCSDSHFLTSLSGGCGFRLKIDSGYLIICEKDKSITPKGKKLPEYLINKAYSWFYQTSLCDPYTGVEALYENQKTGNPETILVGNPRKVFKSAINRVTREKAISWAKLKLKEITDAKETLTLSGPFMMVSCFQPVKIEKFRSGVDGMWIAQEVEHSLSSKETTTTIKLKKD